MKSRRELRKVAEILDMMFAQERENEYKKIIDQLNENPELQELNKQVKDQQSMINSLNKDIAD